MKKEFTSVYCNGVIRLQGNHVVVEGTINDKLSSEYVLYRAAAPCDRMVTFTGSGLPFANKNQAYTNTPNKGKVKLNNSKFEIVIQIPNAYYKEFGVLQLPYIDIMYNNSNTLRISLDMFKNAYRSLEYPNLRKKENTLFYDRILPVRSQEQILRDSEYRPYIEANDFWGLKPPI